MKKSLIALAALASVAGVAQAQSTATIYGTLDVGYGSFDVQKSGSAKSTQKGLMYNTNDSSRWGITTTEDIGGGVKAGVQIESWIGGLPRNNFSYSAGAGASGAGVAGTSGAVTNNFAQQGAGQSIDATSLGNRLLFVQLSSGAHTVRLGQQSSLVRDAAVSFQADGSNVVGNLIGNDGSMTHRAVAATYMYSAANGLTAAAAVANNTRQTDGMATLNTGNGYYAALRYTAGPLDAMAAYSSNKSGSYDTGVGVTTGSNSQLGNPTQAMQSTLLKDVTTKITVLGASYDLTVAKLYAQYGKVDATDALNATSSGNNERHAYSVGARVPFGKAWAFAQLSEGKSRNSGGSYEGNWTGASYGVRYELSKRTYAYAVAGESKQDTSATANTKANQYGAGLVHNF